ncbi:MAG: MAPEG family protein [Roseibium sp.]|uniref:MAPEG family protein n=1 Tax=Roseibium sp. TaxID=1936156 RepID=UPI002620335F|nr:MAPEG family protein [Roseibium sp.]MCV0427305.1 MAPEG family protein [Roseibium sp.]
MTIVLTVSTTMSKGQNMVFSVTPIYALAVALVYLILWFRVTTLRSSLKQSIGDGGNPELLLRVRQHGNCAEWFSFVLILMILAEGMGAPALYLHISGVLLLVGRIAHPFGLKTDNSGHFLRYVGNGTNILASLNAMVCLAVNLVGLWA